ncbi:MAG: DNA mismatch repair protein MutS [Hyphomicrobiales bacterium]|nr:DNA mismatch repair protein MutS [Hyphomicrobiales bacterium]
MMQQFLSIKQAHPDCLLFYRMGDFYELFFEDAITAAEVLDITLTRRGKHENSDIPMCGVPVHSHESYLQKLIRSGFRVAICEQVEDPQEAKKRGHKAVVKREVVRIVTPGTITEDALLDARAPSYLVALAGKPGELALAWAEVSTGEFTVMPVEDAALVTELARIDASEILLPDVLLNDGAMRDRLAEWQKQLVPHVPSFFDAQRAKRRLRRFYGVETLDGFGAFTAAEVAACGALVEYLDLTQKGVMPRLTPPRPFARQHYLVIDAATRRNLELFHTLSGELKGSLLNVIDRTVSGTGGRLLRQWLAAPLTGVDAIRAQQNKVTALVERPVLRDALRHAMKGMPDMERALSRLHMGRATPRDLAAIRDGLGRAVACLTAIRSEEQFPTALSTLTKPLSGHEALFELLGRALKDEVGLKVQEGGYIRTGYDAELDRVRDLHQRSKEHKQALQQRYREETGVERLKVAENNMIGLYAEVNARHIKEMPERFVHRQTLANAVRFGTPELRELQQEIITAAERALSIELEHFETLVQSVLENAELVLAAAQALAQLDGVAGLAELAVTQHYCCPVIEDSTAFAIEEGRHPVVESVLKAQGTDAFIANGCTLGEGQRLWLLTGPNMAGKSTFLRQNALITILAQMGGYVPAKQATIGVVDRLFSRVGASDDLARGHSTFMVEMIETATILNLATERSLVILDEIGRGTATFDGLSIAWAVVEYLHAKSRCRALFATHYHELTALEGKLPNMACHTMRVREWKEQVVFLHEVVAGTADRSYGIHVARLAGLPAPVIARAKEVLTALGRGENTSAAELANDLPLFAAIISQAREVSEPEAPAFDAKGQAMLDQLYALDVDTLSPRAALDLLYRWKQEVL